MIGINDLHQGSFLVFNNEPHEVIYLQHVQMGRQGAIARTKLKNLVTGHLLEKTFKAGDEFEEADLTRSKANFLYKDEENYYFMDNQTFEQFSLTREQVGKKGNYLKEGMDVDLLNFNQKAINIEIPKKIDLKVIQTGEAVRGNTAQGSVTKEATLETGQVIKVPLFIKNGDTVRINTETGKYVERL